MDIHQLEFCADLIYRLCKNNPDLCPHDFCWNRTDKTGRKEYECSVCGKIKILEASESDC